MVGTPNRRSARERRSNNSWRIALLRSRTHDKDDVTMEKSEEPLPAAVMTPWLADNETYQQELQLRDSLLQDLSPIRARIETDPGIRMAEDVERCTLGAVDAASVAASFGDQVSILVQMVHVADDGTPIIGSPQRVTGIDSQEMHMATAPIRVAIEC